MGTDIHHRFERKNPETRKWEEVIDQYEGNRDYRLFAWLADVRNGFGFAGVPWAVGEVKPISEPKGLPKGYDKESYDYGDHSFSYLTDDEILEDYSTNSLTITACGVLSREEYESWDKITRPGSYSGGVWGPQVVMFEEGVRDWTHIRVEWKEDLKPGFKYFVDEVIRLKEKYGEVRMVFGFDS